MSSPQQPAPRFFRFGAFTVDLQLGELRKHGTRIRLQEQPFQVLAMLLQRRGELVTREELRARLWPADTFVDFEHGLNAAISRLRERLDDKAEKPRYIETIPRRGYRFIASAEIASPPGERTPAPEAVPSIPALPRKTLLRFWPVLVVLAACLALILYPRLQHTPSRTATDPAIHSIAVLPLANLSGDPAQDYFADGMTDELISDLAQISALRVISRTLVMQYKGTRQTLRSIGKELSVDALVEGTVERSGGRVRISAQLIQASTDTHLWSKTYERNLGDVIALQDEVAGAIAAEIRVKLLPIERARLEPSRAPNPEAYDAYLQGLYHIHKRTPTDLEKSSEYFERAIALDPQYALAYAGLADSYALRGSLLYMVSRPRT